MKKSKPSLGQNFLSDANAIQRIVSSLGDISQRLVIEIGPGMGAITTLLAARAGTLVAIELDRTLAPLLHAKYDGQPNIHILQQDILATDLTQTIAGHGSTTKALVVGNLPYYITSDIVLHLMAHADAIESAVIMMQREVADRIAAQPGTREFGMLSASVQMMARVENLFTLPPSAFSPPPDVYSSVVRLTMQSRYAELGVERAPFERFLRIAFAQKRKTLANNLRAGGYDLARVQRALAEPGLGIRAEACSVETLAAIHRALAI